MNFLEKIILKINPERALKREIFKRRFNRLQNFNNKKITNQRSFDVASSNRTKYDFLNPQESPDSAIKDSAKTLRNHVRQLEHNTGFIAGPIKRIVNNVVGSGIRFQSRVKADNNSYEFPKITEEDAQKFNYLSEKYTRLWAKKYADVRLIQNFYEIQRTVCGSLLRDGEVLVIGRSSNKLNIRHISFCLQIFEIDRLQTPYEMIQDPKVRNGIEYDEEGTPKTYYVLKEHPGESVVITGFKANDYEEIPAYNKNGTKKVFHLFDMVRPEQSRGYTPFAAALKSLLDMERYKEAEILAALEDACLTGFVKSPAAQSFQANYTEDNIENDDGDETSQRIHSFSPNKWYYLDPGNDVTIHSPKRPNDQFGVFIDQICREIANAIDIPPEVLTQNWQGMNYSNARTVLLQLYLACRVMQAFIIDHLCIPVYENVISELVGFGKIWNPAFRDRKEDFMNSAWISPGWSWIDPVKEANGKILEIDNNIDTMSNTLASKGMDFEETIDLIAFEKKKIQEKEKKYGVKITPVDKTNITNNQEDKNNANTSK